MSTRLSVIIPNYNGSAFLDTCLKALYFSEPKPYEVIVVDDCSTDNSAEIIARYPCRLIRQDRQGGASKARNTGAAAGSGNVLFFIDADCVVKSDTLLKAVKAYENSPLSVTGGSYTPAAFDDAFFSNFQSIFINYSELKRPDPDYIAGHAMIIARDIFAKSGGFPEDFMPVIEDVEFSHRLRRTGVRLIMDGSVLVRHIFNYDLKRSLGNAFRKSKYWTAYSFGNRDMTADSGTASIELKFNVLCSALLWTFLICLIISGEAFFLACMLAVSGFNLIVNRRLIKAFFTEKGPSFGIKAALYYSFLYPLLVAAGGLAGLLYYLRMKWGKR